MDFRNRWGKMTNKQMIDDVDVSECKYFCLNQMGNNCLNHNRGFSMNCNNNNCYFKKYKRKEQECEQEKALKETYLACYKAKHGDITGELFKLKQTLTEIKEIAEPYKMTIKKICRNCKKYDDCNACCYKDINCYKYTSPKTNACEEFTYLDEFVLNILANSILQKISECEVENERNRKDV